MSKLTELLSLLPKGLKNGDKIVEGLINQVKLEFNQLSEDEVNEIARRRLICQECPFNSFKAKTSPEYKEAFNTHYNVKREDLHCSICKCIIATKTASLDSECGIKDEKETEDLELKWNKYK